MKTNWVVIRSNMSGVHFGKLDWRKGGTVQLSLARRIWSWENAKTCTHIALYGCTGNIGPESTIIIRGFEELIQATEEAADRISAVQVWK